MEGVEGAFVRLLLEGNEWSSNFAVIFSCDIVPKWDAVVESSHVYNMDVRVHCGVPHGYMLSFRPIRTGKQVCWG